MISVLWQKCTRSGAAAPDPADRGAPGRDVAGLPVRQFVAGRVEVLRAAYRRRRRPVRLTGRRPNRPRTDWWPTVWPGVAIDAQAGQHLGVPSSSSNLAFMKSNQLGELRRLPAGPVQFGALHVERGVLEDRVLPQWSKCRCVLMTMPDIAGRHVVLLQRVGHRPVDHPPVVQPPLRAANTGINERRTAGEAHDEAVYRPGRARPRPRRSPRQPRDLQCHSVLGSLPGAAGTAAGLILTPWRQCYSQVDNRCPQLERRCRIARHSRFLLAVIVASAAAMLTSAVPASAQTAVDHVAAG